MKSGNPNFLEPSGPLQACNGAALPFPYILEDVLFWSFQINLPQIYGCYILERTETRTRVHMPRASDRRDEYI